MSTPNAPLGWTKAYASAPDSALWLRVHELHPVAPRASQRRLEVVDLERDVVEPLAALGQEPSYGRVGAGGLQQLHRDPLRVNIVATMPCSSTISGSPLRAEALLIELEAASTSSTAKPRWWILWSMLLPDRGS